MSAALDQAGTPSDIDRHAPVPMYHQLKRRIVDDIARLGLRPGDVLPGEHRLCEKFGVSRTVVRQALSQLEHQGVTFDGRVLRTASRANTPSWPRPG